MGVVSTCATLTPSLCPGTLTPLSPVLFDSQRLILSGSLVDEAVLLLTVQQGGGYSRSGASSGQLFRKGFMAEPI